MRRNLTAKPQPLARRKPDLNLNVLSELNICIGIYEAATQANIVNPSLMPAR